MSGVCRNTLEGQRPLSDQVPLSRVSLIQLGNGSRGLTVVVLAQEAQYFVAELLSMLKEEGVSRVAVQDDFGVRQPLRHGVGGERVDHDVVGPVGDEDWQGQLCEPVPDVGAERADRSALGVDGLGRDIGVRLAQPSVQARCRVHPSRHPLPVLHATQRAQPRTMRPPHLSPLKGAYAPFRENWLLASFDTAGEPLYHACFRGENTLKPSSVRGFASSISFGDPDN